MSPATKKQSKAKVEEPGAEGTSAGDNDHEDADVETVDVDALQQQLAEHEETIAAKDEEIAALQAKLESGTAATPQASVVSGERCEVTYLGRPELIAHDEDGEPTEEDVYVSVDHADASKGIHLHVGETADVSAEKAAQLEADFPDAFEIS